ncbi:hypothetical protein, partial [Streptomyces albidoflavus]|uniref:hypothetical protein n=1 Tax=Streptomyces albidoflavus TaxID=1886 RepID=UPI0033E98F38
MNAPVDPVEGAASGVRRSHSVPGVGANPHVHVAVDAAESPVEAAGSRCRTARVSVDSDLHSTVDAPERTVRCRRCCDDGPAITVDTDLDAPLYVVEGAARFGCCQRDLAEVSGRA